MFNWKFSWHFICCQLRNDKNDILIPETFRYLFFMFEICKLACRFLLPTLKNKKRDNLLNILFNKKKELHLQVCLTFFLLPTLRNKKWKIDMFTPETSRYLKFNYEHIKKKCFWYFKFIEPYLLPTLKNKSDIQVPIHFKQLKF